MKIRKEFSRLILAHTTLVVLFIAIVLGVALTNNQLKSVYKNARNLGHTAADLLDGETLEAYAQTQVKDEAYDETKEALRRLKANFNDCKYMYIFVPAGEKEAIYIYDIYTDEEYESGDVDEGELGFVEDFTAEVLGSAIEVYQTGSETNKLDIDVFNKYGSVATYYVPVYGKDGLIRAIVGIDYDFTEFVHFILYMFLGIFILIIIGCSILAYFELRSIDTRMVKPIEQISRQASAFANSKHNGNSESFRLEEKPGSENELDILAGDMNKMMQDIDDYIDNIETITAERERIGAELDLAEQIQRSSLPCVFPPFPNRNEFDLYATMDPAKEVGGDFYDFFLIDEEHLGLVIADVSGKGVGAALFMMISKTLLNNQAMFTESPADVLRLVNEKLCENNEAAMFVTVWLGILNLKTGVMRAANAGHEYPVIKRAGQDFELLKDRHGFVMGGMSGVKYREYEIAFQPGDTLYVYTDGVPEATNAENELFGTDRMLKSLNARKDASLEELLKGVAEDIDGFVLDAPQFDDITMLGMTYQGYKL